jgi:hypothetical protein
MSENGPRVRRVLVSRMAEGVGNTFKDMGHWKVEKI